MRAKRAVFWVYRGAVILSVFVLLTVAYTVALLPLAAYSEENAQWHGYERLPLWVRICPYPVIDTAFAEEFSFAGLRRVQIGDSAERLLELCGEPIRRETVHVGELTGHALWRYSISPSHTHHWQVTVFLDPKSQIVVDKQSAFYLD